MSCPIECITAYAGSNTATGTKGRIMQECWLLIWLDFLMYPKTILIVSWRIVRFCVFKNTDSCNLESTALSNWVLNRFFAGAYFSQAERNVPRWHQQGRSVLSSTDRSHCKENAHSVNVITACKSPKYICVRNIAGKAVCTKLCMVCLSTYLTSSHS